MKYFLILLLLLNSFTIYGQEVEGVTETEEAKEQLSPEEQRQQRLFRFRKELILLSKEIKSLKKELDSDIDMVSRIQKESRVTKLEKEYREKKYKFIQTITDIDLNKKLLSEKETTFSEDIRQILDPVLQSFKKISQKPRAIQSLTERKEKVETKLQDAKGALTKIKKFEEEIRSNKNLENLKYKVSDSEKLVEALVKDLSQQLEDINFDLKHIRENEESIVTTFSSIIFDFIKTKGKNLVLALLIFSIVYWLFRFSQDRLINLILFRLSKSQHREFYEWLIRPTRVIYAVFTFFIAFFMSILTLYVLNDWVLVTIILITFAALIWSSKQYFPQFFEQSKIVLNLGAVREGERIIYQGLPWKIKSLGYYCRLTNPDLEGGNLRINTKELLNANSRKINLNEPWFPSKKGDWVESNGLFGQVVLQTPEQVVVENVGGEKKYLLTPDFYALQPKNLTQGFSIDFPFGVDYSHQKIVLTEVIPNLKEHVDKRLQEDYPQVKQALKRSSIEFMQAGASSLDLRVFYKFTGELASLKQAMSRSIKAYIVEACNEHHYIIPFNQLTVHMQK